MECGRSVKKIAGDMAARGAARRRGNVPAFADELWCSCQRRQQSGTARLPRSQESCFSAMTVIHNGDRLRPLLNEAEPRLKDVFLQNIVSMTDMTYDRRILRLALQGRRSLRLFMRIRSC